jgi:hypothetical protein
MVDEVCIPLEKQIKSCRQCLESPGKKTLLPSPNNAAGSSYETTSQYEKNLPQSTEPYRAKFITI